MFIKQALWRFWLGSTEKPPNDNAREISLFDVKGLYDAAYDDRLTKEGRFEERARLLQAAEALEQAYRRQENLAGAAQESAKPAQKKAA